MVKDRAVQHTKKESKTGYRWQGMTILTPAEVDILYKKGLLDGCFKLYPDQTESLIDGISLSEIKDHYDKGGEFGEELPRINLVLPDNTEISAPETVDLSELGVFDEMEYKLWDTIKEYMQLFGIRIETGDDSPDWTTVKAVQDKILEILTDSGVNFVFE